MPRPHKTSDVGSSPAAPTNNENTRMNEQFDPYEFFGISKNADETAIKAAYRKLVKVHHPDKGGTAINFENITKWYKKLIEDCNKPLVFRLTHSPIYNKNINEWLFDVIFAKEYLGKNVNLYYVDFVEKKTKWGWFNLWTKRFLISFRTEPFILKQSGAVMYFTRNKEKFKVVIRVGN